MVEKENKNNAPDNNNEKRNMTASSTEIEPSEMRSKYHDSCVEIVKKSINNQNVYFIKGILKPERPCSRVIMSCETSGAHFEDRCIPLYKKEETNIGRFSKFGGEKPDVVSKERSKTIRLSNLVMSNHDLSIIES